MSDIEEQSTRFAKGRWVLAQPAKPGLYLVRARYGYVTKLIATYCDDAGATIPASPWEAWFWSEPLPRLPQTPDFGIDSSTRRM